MKFYSYIAEKYILRLADFILRTTVRKSIMDWREIQWYQKNKLDHIQKKRLFSLLLHCKKNIPYYKKLLKEVDLHENSDPLLLLKKIPILTKKNIKENLPDDIIDKDRKVHSFDMTSGSTGEQGVFYHDHESFSNSIAIQTLWWEWAGYNLGDKKILIGMNSKSTGKHSVARCPGLEY